MTVLALPLIQGAGLTDDDWAGLAISVIGAVLVLHVFGVSRGLAEFLGPMKDEARWTMAGTPRTTWQWRMLGAGVLLFGVAVVVFADPA